MSKLRKLLIPKFGGNILSELRLHLANRYQNGYTPFLGKRIKYSDAASFLASRNEIFGSSCYEFRTENDRPVIIDCGSNIGLSIIFFKSKYPQSKVIGYEADPVIFEILKENVNNYCGANDSLHNAAVWVDDEGVLFEMQGGMSGTIRENDRSTNVEKIESIDLNNTLEKFELIDFLKIDIEGAERYVLPHIEPNLGRVKNLFFEYHVRKEEDQFLEQLLGLLSDQGFRYHIKEAFTREKPFVSEEVQTGFDLQLDIFAINERL